MVVKGASKDKVRNDFMGTAAELTALNTSTVAAFSTFTVVDGNGKIVDCYIYDGVKWNN